MTRRVTILLCTLALGSRLPAQGVVHVEGNFGWSLSAVSNARLDDRVRAAAAEYHHYAPIPRIAFFDIAYPADSAEFVALAGNALLVVTALVQDSTEIPFASVYLRSATSIDSLRPVVAVLSRVV